MTTDQRTPQEIAYDATRLSYGPIADQAIAQRYDIPAMLAEVERRLDDPARPPMQLRTEPLSPAELQETLCGFRCCPPDHQERLLGVLEHIADLPEPERTRQIEGLYIAIDVVQEHFAA